MTNERYLVVSYFVCVILAIGLGALVYLYLRRPFSGVADAASGKHLRAVLKGLFPVGLLFPALLGFASVSYESCNRTTYEKIIQSRSYLIQKSHEQISSTLLSIAIAVLAWNAVLFLITKFARTSSENVPDSQGPNLDPPSTPLKFK